MRKIILVAFLFASMMCSGQMQGNIWYFGNHSGLDFSSGVPVSNSGGATQSQCEGTSVICDDNGSLLFYSNGSKAWNRNHQVMANGDSLLGHWSSTQSSLIVPQPGSSRYFYLFTTDAFQNNLLNGLTYSIVDMCLDNGLGDIVPGQKNIPLLGGVAEKLTGIRHANGVDYWIITHKYFSTAFYAYHLTDIGIVDTVISNIGSYHPISPQNYGGAIGQLKASPDGRKLAIVNGNNVSIAEYFDFDKNTGIVSNCVNIQSSTNFNYYGVSFSPDNSKLYIACWLNGNGIYQFDLNAGGGNPSAVIASRTQIASGAGYYGLQLANDGKIYSATAPLNSNRYIGVIYYPDSAGVSCNFIDSAKIVAGTVGASFPNFIDSYDYSNTTENCKSEAVDEDVEESVHLFLNPFDSNLIIQSMSDRKFSISIYDILSRKILNETFSTYVELDMAPFSNGVYVYVLDDGSGNFRTGKIVKEK